MLIEVKDKVKTLDCFRAPKLYLNSWPLDEPFHLAELGYFVNALSVEQHDVFLLELLDAIKLLRRQRDVCVHQHRHFAAKFVQLGDRSL